MVRGLLRRTRSEHGSSLVETAIMSFVLLLLFAGAVDIGRMYYSYVIITNAAREGARTAARSPCNTSNAAVLRSTIIAAAQRETSSLPSFPAAGAVAVTVNPDPTAGCPTAGNPVQVTVTYQYRTFYANLLNRATIPMSYVATMTFAGNDQLP